MYILVATRHSHLPLQKLTQSSIDEFGEFRTNLQGTAVVDMRQVRSFK